MILCTTCNIITFSGRFYKHKDTTCQVIEIGGKIDKNEKYNSFGAWISDFNIYATNGELHLNNRPAEELVKIKQLLTYLKKAT